MAKSAEVKSIYGGRMTIIPGEPDVMLVCGGHIVAHLSGDDGQGRPGEGVECPERVPHGVETDPGEPVRDDELAEGGAGIVSPGEGPWLFPGPGLLRPGSPVRPQQIRPEIRPGQSGPDFGDVVPQELGQPLPEMDGPGMLALGTEVGRGPDMQDTGRDIDPIAAGGDDFPGAQAGQETEMQDEGEVVPVAAGQEQVPLLPRAVAVPPRGHKSRKLKAEAGVFFEESLGDEPGAKAADAAEFAPDAGGRQVGPEVGRVALEHVRGQVRDHAAVLAGALPAGELPEDVQGVGGRLGGVASPRGLLQDIAGRFDQDTSRFAGGRVLPGEVFVTAKGFGAIRGPQRDRGRTVTFFHRWLPIPDPALLIKSFDFHVGGNGSKNGSKNKGGIIGLSCNGGCFAAVFATACGGVAGCLDVEGVDDEGLKGSAPAPIRTVNLLIRSQSESLRAALMLWDLRRDGSNLGLQKQ